MKQIVLIVAAALALSACSSTEKGAAVGAIAGAGVGAATTGSVAGAGVGALVGGAAGAVIGKVAGTENQCYYRDAAGNTYRAQCPAG